MELAVEDAAAAPTGEVAGAPPAITAERRKRMELKYDTYDRRVALAKSVLWLVLLLGIVGFSVYGIVVQGKLPAQQVLEGIAAQFGSGTN